jgi:hypothetical protein
VTSRVTASNQITAPVHRVFAFFDDVGNAKVLVPNLIQISKVEELPGGGRRVEYTTRTRKGDAAESSSEHVVYEPPVRTVTRGVQSGVTTMTTREFAVAGSGSTLVTATLEWSVPVRYVAKLVEYPLRAPFRRALRAGLSAAKGEIEKRL